MVSNGEGRTTCSYFLQGGKKFFNGTTFMGKKECPPNPDYSKGYVWAIYPITILSPPTRTAKKSNN
jgi:hypothetical protein